jgi:DtxR family Mn-dependent transcriptional regulator
VQLTDADAGSSFVVARISDADPAVLRYLADKGIQLDSRLTVTEHRPYAGDVTIQVDGNAEPVELGALASDAVWVSAVTG